MVESQLLGSLTHVETAVPLAALTFDDGPDPVFTPALLDVLSLHKAKGTFFVLGEFVERYPEIVDRMRQEGHALGNHTWNHPSFGEVGGRVRRTQIRACAKVLGRARPRLFRPPYGHQTLASRLDLLWLGYEPVLFNQHASDWCDSDSARMRKALLDELRPGNIIVLHDAIRRSRQKQPVYDRTGMIKGLAGFLEDVGDRYRFLTVPELVARGVPHRQNWIYYEPAPNAATN